MYGQMRLYVMCYCENQKTDVELLEEQLKLT